MQTLNETKKHRKKWVFSVFLLIAVMWIMSAAVFAAAKEDAGITILKQLQSYEIDSTSNILNSAARQVGFGVVKFLGEMADSLYSGIGKIYKYLTFGYSDQITSLAGRYSVLYKILFIVSVTFFGLYLICGKNTNQLNTANCIILIVLVVAAMPLFTQKMAKLTVAGGDYVRAQWVETTDVKEVKSVASSVLDSNLVDLQKVDENITNGTTIKGLKKNKGYNDLKVGTKDWRYLDMESIMDYDGELNNDFWNQELIQNSEGEYETKDMEGWFDIGNSYYYRYQILSWFNMIALLISVVFIEFFICIKCGKIVIDIAMANIYMPFVAVTDLASGQRIREALKNFLVLFAVLFLCIALAGVYFAGFSFINEKVTGTIPKLAMHIGLAWAILDGPSIIERIAGVDVGMKSVAQKLMGLRAGMAIGGAAAKAGAKIGGGVKKASGAAAAAVFGSERVSAAKEKMHTAASDTVKRATDGKGLLGAAGNAAGKAGDGITEMGKAMQDHMTSDTSTKGLNRMAQAADSGYATTPGTGIKTEESAVRTSMDSGAHSETHNAAHAEDNLSRIHSNAEMPGAAAGASPPEGIRTGVGAESGKTMQPQPNPLDGIASKSNTEMKGLEPNSIGIGASGERANVQSMAQHNLDAAGIADPSKEFRRAAIGTSGNPITHNIHQSPRSVSRPDINRIGNRIGRPAEQTRSETIRTTGVKRPAIQPGSPGVKGRKGGK